MIATLTTANENQVFSDFSLEEKAMMKRCMENMIGHIERNIDRPHKNHKQVSRLLSYRYLIQKNLISSDN